MRVVVTGGRGLLGSALVESLQNDGHETTVVSRSSGPGRATWDQLEDSLEGADAVVNLVGASIAKRWTPEYKKELRASRVHLTDKLTRAVLSLQHKPGVVISSSAVGYYGAGDEDVAEDASAGDDFLAELCQAWESAAAPMATGGSRLVLQRTAPVLSRTGGPLAKMWLPFKLGLGGALGSGKQPFPWIHIADWVALTRFTLENEHAHGPLNAVAPKVATNGEFATALGKALRRPTLLPVPAVMLRAMFGEMADMLLEGQRPIPKQALALGFRFKFPTIEAALADLCG